MPKIVVTALNAVTGFMREEMDFQSKFTARAIKIALRNRQELYNILGELVYHKNLLKRHSNSIITSIEDIASFSNVTITKACKL